MARCSNLKRKKPTCDNSQVGFFFSVGKMEAAVHRSRLGGWSMICVEQGCQWLRYVCTEAALRELVANWHWPDSFGQGRHPGSRSRHR